MCRFAFAAVCVLLTGPARAESGPSTTLDAGTVREIFRLVVGQPELNDTAVGVTTGKDGIWTCVWTRESDREVIVLQIRDRDGAYRRPDISDLSTLRFGIRLDLRERIAKLIEERRPSG